MPVRDGFTGGPEAGGVAPFQGLGIITGYLVAIGVEEMDKDGIVWFRGSEGTLRKV